VVLRLLKSDDIVGEIIGTYWIPSSGAACGPSRRRWENIECVPISQRKNFDISRQGPA
jgi:hypothetical protein